MRPRAVAVAAPFGWSEVKKPPITRRPSACCARELTDALAFGLKVASSVPSALKRAMLFRGVVPASVKEPPTTILPSA